MSEAVVTRGSASTGSSSDSSGSKSSGAIHRVVPPDVLVVNPVTEIILDNPKSVLANFVSANTGAQPVFEAIEGVIGNSRQKLFRYPLFAYFPFSRNAHR